jgi:hypothetical protein
MKHGCKLSELWFASHNFYAAMIEMTTTIERVFHMSGFLKNTPHCELLKPGAALILDVATWQSDEKAALIGAALLQSMLELQGNCFLRGRLTFFELPHAR